ncbi:hypothetical protein [Fuerstiella marisgermanici]|uniref:Uncharacterized protein n=1 Tax=Fuerstiella marisgermanici TaxID=1891926 RepID=A0A1P8WK26_9PLAN|nr:hypothetical protein [Fuerstiella marisgermanici]APZ94391.1 hypothetical protein Fuma_04023 [Fuerstiella marisgermanici]
MKFRTFLGWAVLATVLIVQRPLTSTNLWWHLSRGREVASGSWTPSQVLLTLDHSCEADWLSGVPFYFGWTLGGVHFLAMVPLAACAVMLVLLKGSLSHCRNLFTAAMFLPLFLWSARGDLQPVPAVFDLVFLVFLWLLSSRWKSKRTFVTLIFLTFVPWSNLGPRPIVGLLWLMCCDWRRVTDPPAGPLAVASDSAPTASASHQTRRWVIQIFAAAVVGGSLTPRGLFTWSDACVLLSPTSFVSVGEYSETSWPGLFSNQPWTAAEWAFVLLWTLWAGNRFLCRQQPPEASDVDRRPLALRRYVGCCVPLVLVILSRSNLAICGLWICLDALSATARGPKESLNWRFSGKPILLPAAFVVALAAMIVDANGRALASYGRLGWGISQELDPRLLDISLRPDKDEPVIGWAADGRSTGIAAWRYPEMQLCDHPQRALLGGRVREHSMLIEDLQGDHRARYRRDDGTWGGWVQRLADWKVQLMLVPVEMQQLNRDLQKITWRPLDLDSPTVPYVSTDDLRYSDAILATMQQEWFVESGPWQPTAEIYSGQDWRFDIIGEIGGTPDPIPAIRQAQRFRATGIPVAALRALLPIRHHNHHPALIDEFRKCQLALADQEWTTFGRTTLFRRLIAERLNLKPQIPNGIDGETTEDATAPSTDVWDKCIKRYIAGELTEAIHVLQGGTPQEYFAAAMLWLELGETSQALAALQPLLSDQRDLNLAIAAKFWSEQMALDQGQ